MTPRFKILYLPKNKKSQMYFGVSTPRWPSSAACGEHQAVKCDQKYRSRRGSFGGKATPELCSNLLENSQNMAAGGFCVSDCSSPRRPSCCHYRLVPLLYRRTQCFHLGGVYMNKVHRRLVSTNSYTETSLRKFIPKKKKKNIREVAFSYVVLLSSAISLTYQVQQFNRNLETDYSDLFTWLSPLPRPLIYPTEMRQITEN